MRNLPAIDREACKVFDIEQTSTEIVILEKQQSPFGYDPSKRNLSFSKENGPEVFGKLGLSFLKYFPSMNLSDISTIYLAHEVPHRVHDAVTDYEFGKEELELHKKSIAENKHLTNLVVLEGISEGIADCAKTHILSNLGMNGLLAAEKTRSKYLNEEDSKRLSSYDVEKLAKEEIEILPSVFDLSPLTPIISLTGSRFRKQLENDGLESFRKFSREFMPRYVTYEYAKEILSRVLEDAKGLSSS